MTDLIIDNLKAIYPDFLNLLIEAVFDGLANINEVDSNSHYAPWVSIGYQTNGLPNMSSSWYNPSPKKYTDQFNKHKSKQFLDFYEYVNNQPELLERILWPKRNTHNELDAQFQDVLIRSIITRTIDRCIHKGVGTNSKRDEVLRIAEETTNFYFLKSLPIDIIVPILFVKFDFDVFDISETISIKKMDEDFQKSRFSIRSYSSSIHDCVLSSATHSLCLKGWSGDNSKSTFDFKVFDNPSSYPIERIDEFFGILRVEKKLATGYAQILAKAKKWHHSAPANLPQLDGATIRSFPDYLENFYWLNDEIPSINRSEMSQIQNLYLNLSGAKENSLHLAMKRLNYCMNRNTEEDAVLDATIGLEALLSDDGNQEMTHKLAMRIGALCKHLSGLKKTPAEGFSDIKSIYNHRSAIVHGSKDVDKKRIIKTTDGKTIQTVSVATDYLREVIKLLIQNPELRSPKFIDQNLLLENSFSPKGELFDTPE